MTRPALDRLAERHGIVLEHWTMEGALFKIPDAAKLRLLKALGVDASSDASIERELAKAGEAAYAAPEPGEAGRCFIPAWLENGRAWGVSLMLYELRSRRNWGIGDFADLAAVAAVAAQAGADFVGTNPLHALFLAAPERASPFSPSSRLFLNPLYIAVDRLAGGAPSEAEAAEIAGLRAASLVDYAAVSRLKFGALRRTFGAWQAAAAAALPQAGFEAFQRRHGEALARHALFEALSSAMAAAGHGAGWRSWPEGFRTPESEAVRHFAAANAGEVAFHAWLQWIAASQLEEAAQAAKGAGMRIGLYLDFAVGEAPDGSSAWSKPALCVPGMSIGAPPDMFTTDGQDWNLTPPNPAAMAREDFAGFEAVMEALTGSAGALRIDHVMALRQLFLVPEGGRPADGAYVRYPLETLLQRLGALSRRNETVVIGEDLGVVPSGFREVMAAANILSYRILYFEQRDGYFLAPFYYPRLALACLSTHDLPTWKGWWRGDDVGLRREAGLIDEQAASAQAAERDAQRRALVKAMHDAELLTEAALAEADAALHAPEAEPPLSLALAAHRFVARTPSLLAGVRLADLAGESGPTNLPGTTDGFPNWRPRLGVMLEDLAETALFQAVTGVLAAERPKSR